MPRVTNFAIKNTVAIPLSSLTVQKKKKKKKKYITKHKILSSTKTFSLEREDPSKCKSVCRAALLTF